MPTTRAARRAARCLTEVLPADALGLVLYQLTLAHDIASVAPTCRALDAAAKLALKLRPFSGEVVTLAGHTEDVVAVQAAPDGRIITSAWDFTVKVWRDGACERTIQAHDDWVRAVAVLPGGARFVSVSDDTTVKLWTLDGTLERSFQPSLQPMDDDDRLVCVAICVAALPDGVHFVIGNNTDEVNLYHVDGTLVHTFDGHADTVFSLAVTPDGQYIISGDSRGPVKVWHVPTKSLVTTCVGHAGWVWAIAVMPDGQRFLSGSEDSTIRVWLLDGTLENTFELHDASVHALVALPNNQHALSGSGLGDGTVKLFNVNDGAVLRIFKHHGRTNLGPGTTTSLALLPDGLRFVSGSNDETARIAYHGLAPQ